MLKKPFLLAAVFALMLTALSARQASALLTLTPDDADFKGTMAGNPDADEVETITGFAGDLTELYKAEVDPSGEEGPFAGSYDTEFSNTEADPADATISFTGGGSIADPEFLLVKDGNHDPFWYVFDISDWDGLMDIELSGFWPDNGAISHVSILGSSTDVIPEPASMIVWGLLASVGLCVGWRRRRQRTA